MMFDNAGLPPTSRRQLVARHAPLALLCVAAVGIAAGIHLASVALAVIAGGHLALALVLFGIRAVRHGPTKPVSS
jgi:hypothetical protein